MASSAIHHLELCRVGYRDHPKKHRLTLLKVLYYTFVYQQYTPWDLDGENLFQARDLEDHCSFFPENHQLVLDESHILSGHKLESYHCRQNR